MVCVHGHILLGENISIIKKKTEYLLNISKEVNLQINSDKTKYIFMSCSPNYRG